MTSVTTTVESGAVATSATRWSQLIFCILCMVLIANLQYGWTLFVNPMQQAHGWSLASIQFAFSIFIALETWLTPIEGWIVDTSRPTRRTEASWSRAAASWSPSAGSSIRARTRSRCCISARWWAAPAAARSTRPASAKRSNGSRTGAALPVGLTAAGLRRRCGAHRHSHPQSSLQPATRRRSSGSDLVQGGIVFILAWLLREPDPGEMRRGRRAKGRADRAKLHARAGAEHAGFLAALHHVRPGLGERPDGDGADRADRQGLQRRERVLLFGRQR